MIVLAGLLCFDAIVDLGSGTFQVGTLRRVGSGNPIEAILNTQSKRFSPTIVAYDGEQFHVGEYGAAYFRRNPGPVFRYFTNSPVNPITDYANDPEAPELEDIQGYQSVLLITALMNHIVNNMIKRNDTTIDITLIHPPKWSLSHLSAFKQSVEQLPNTSLFMTVPTPVAVVITHLASRMKDFDKEGKGQQFVVIDIGATMTEVSVVQAVYNNQSSDVEVSLMHNEDYNKGGEAITQCLCQKFVYPKLKNFKQNDFKLRKRVEDAVEKAKIVLSAQQFTKLTIESAAGPQEDFVMELFKHNVDQCVEELFAEEAVQHFQNTAFYIDPELGEEQTHYLFYGGSSRVPRLQRLFEDFFGAQVLRTVNMDEGAIYGGGLVAARHIVGFKVANRFNALDQTRPYLHYENAERGALERLYRLNPHVRFGLQTDFPAYANDTFSLANASFSVNHINETHYWETDESGERKKKSSQLYNTANVEYSKIVSSPDPFKTLRFVSYVDEENPGEVFFTYSCNLTIAPFDHKTILKKYEAKKKPGEVNSGMQGIKIQKMPEIRRDAERYSKSVQDFQELLLKHLTDEDTRRRYDLRLALNFTSDATSMPNLTYAAMHVIDREKLGKKGANATITEFQFEPKCRFEHNPRFMVDEYMFREAFNVVWDSNDIQDKRKQYEDSFNTIETILINADEFLQRYPASEENEGNHLVYAEEADFLRVAIDDARYFMKHASLLPVCPCAECLEERIRDLDAVLKRVIDLQANISQHVELAQCRPGAEDKFNKALDRMEAAHKAALDLQESDKGKQYNDIMFVCEIVKALEIDKDDEKKDKDKDKDKDKKKDGEEEKKESEVDRLKKLKKHQITAKVPKAQLEKYYFEDMFYLYGMKTNKTEDETKGLENFYTKGMMKKLKKTNNDCGFLNGSYSNMLKKLDNYTNSKNGTQKSYREFKATFESEMKLRPETDCEKIKNKTKDIEKEAGELEKKVKDVRGELDRARLTKVLDQLYNQAVEYRKLIGVLEKVKHAVSNKKLKEAAELITEAIQVKTSEQTLEKVLVGKLRERFMKADIDSIDRVFDDIKEQVKQYGDESKDEL